MYGTSAQIMQAEQAAEEAIAALRERISELQAEVRERVSERMQIEPGMHRVISSTPDD